MKNLLLLFSALVVLQYADAVYANGSDVDAVENTLTLYGKANVCNESLKMMWAIVRRVEFDMPGARDYEPTDNIPEGYNCRLIYK